MADENAPRPDDATELDDRELDKASGGLTFPDVSKTPSPGGPVPIPYPNTSTTTTTK